MFACRKSVNVRVSRTRSAQEAGEKKRKKKVVCKTLASQCTVSGCGRQGRAALVREKRSASSSEGFSKPSAASCSTLTPQQQKKTVTLSSHLAIVDSAGPEPELVAWLLGPGVHEEKGLGHKCNWSRPDDTFGVCVSTRWVAM